MRQRRQRQPVSMPSEPQRQRNEERAARDAEAMEDFATREFARLVWTAEGER